MIKAEVQNESQEVRVTLNGSKQEIAKELYAILVQITEIGNPDIVSLSLHNYNVYITALNKEAEDETDERIVARKEEFRSDMIKTLQYNGCKNCQHQIAPLRSCKWAEQGGDGRIHYICPKWDKKEED